MLLELLLGSYWMFFICCWKKLNYIDAMSWIQLSFFSKHPDPVLLQGYLDEWCFYFTISIYNYVLGETVNKLTVYLNKPNGNYQSTGTCTCLDVLSFISRNIHGSYKVAYNTVHLVRRIVSQAKWITAK